MNIVFRTDGNEKIGAGHIMRCLSLADALRKLGADIVFATSDDVCGELIESRGYQGVDLNSSWFNYCDRLEVLLGLLDKNKTRLIITDSYFASNAYFAAIHKRCKTALISEYAPDETLSGIDLFINYNLYMNNYPVNHNCYITLLGSRYALIREDFGRSFEKEGDDILLLTGGSDPCNSAARIVRELRAALATDEKIRVITGAFNPHIEDLRHACDNSKARLLVDVVNMARQMRGAKIAISAAGSTLYELCACGIPTISYAFADNQIENALAFAEHGAIPYAGDYRADPRSCISNIVSLCRDYIGDGNIRTLAAESMRQICDEKGAKRAASRLVELINGGEDDK